jgi:hypothetical protein
MTGAGRIRVIALTLVAAGVSLAAGAPGDLDTGYGTGGVGTISVPTGLSYRDGARQSDGGIVLVGSQPSPLAWRAFRLDASGLPDATFSDGGGVPDGKTVNDAETDSLDRIILCGFMSRKVTVKKKTTTVTGLGVARLTPSGSLDSTFGTGGVVFDTFADIGNLSSPDGSFAKAREERAGVLIKLKRYAEALADADASIAGLPHSHRAHEAPGTLSVSLSTRRGSTKRA